jgi:DNA-directed RNA polymerase subunit RPC12/RpoP
MDEEWEYEDDTVEQWRDNRSWKLDFVEHKIRTAKKDYHCADCGKTLKAGSKYMDFSTKAIRTRFCIDCGKIACGGPREE